MEKGNPILSDSPLFPWWSQRGSNPRFRRERATNYLTVPFLISFIPSSRTGNTVIMRLSFSLPLRAGRLVYKSFGES